MRIRTAASTAHDARIQLLAALAITVVGLSLNAPLLTALGAGAAGYLIGQGAHPLARVDPRFSRTVTGHPPARPVPPAESLEGLGLAPEDFDRQLAATGWPRSPDP